MKYYLTTRDNENKRELTILTAGNESYEKQEEEAIKKMKEKREEFDRIEILEIKREGEEVRGFDPNAILAEAIASRKRWTMYNKNGKMVGSGNGTWEGWHIKTKGIKNTTVAILTLAKIERSRKTNW